MSISRRALVLHAAALLPTLAWAGRRGLWDEPGERGRVVIFRQEGGKGPGVSERAIRAFVANGPPATVGLVAGFGLRILGASARTPASFAHTTAMLLAPAKVLVVEGQLLVPTLDEALRALLVVEALPIEELADDTWARLAQGENVESETLLARAHPLVVQAVQAKDDRVLRRLGMAQLGAWHEAPPPGL